MISDDGWTADEAGPEFAKTGIPFEPEQVRGIIRWLPGFLPVGEQRHDGPGRGKAMYDIGELQELHGALAKWLRVPS